MGTSVILEAAPELSKAVHMIKNLRDRPGQNYKNHVPENILSASYGHMEGPSLESSKKRDLRGRLDSYP